MLTNHQENLISNFEKNMPNSKTRIITLILHLQEGILKNKNRLWNSHSNLTFKDQEDIDNLKLMLVELNIKELHARALAYVKSFYETHNKVQQFKKQFRYSI